MAASLSSRLAFAVATAWTLAVCDVRGADSVTVSLYTTVLPVCRFGASAPDAAAGPRIADDGSAWLSGAITYRCTNGVAPTFAITASIGCPACEEASASGSYIVSESAAVGRGMGSGRELTLLVGGPGLIAPLHTALNDVSITVSP
jgi:hypothetical protein